jgi:NADH-quinone oxidoreductase subunit M
VPPLLWLLLFPLVGCGWLLVFAMVEKRAKELALVASLCPLILLAYGQQAWVGSSFMMPWLPTLGINFHLVIDALSLPFLYLTAIVVPISLCVAKSNNATPLTPRFFALILGLEALMLAFFMAQDLVLFIALWEAILFPIYFIILFWGGLGRQKASLKFLIYMIAGSALMVAATLALYFHARAHVGATFDIQALSAIPLPSMWQKVLCAVFLLAFAVKTPLFPFHAWLPLAYGQASTSGSILLAGVLSKAGIYAFLRIGVGLFPVVFREWSPFLAALAIVGVLYAAIAAAMQNDFKQLIAYSSLSHVNFILVGIFVWDSTAHEAAILQAFNHSITIAALFVVAHWLEVRIGSTSMGQVHGVATYMPKLCWITLAFAMAAVSLPSTSNFVGELLILSALFKKDMFLTALLTLSVILSAVYMLRWMQKVFFEEPSPRHENWTDINFKEIAVICPLLLLVFWIGLYPNVLWQQINMAPTKPSSLALNEEFHE